MSSFPVQGAIRVVENDADEVPSQYHTVRLGQDIEVDTRLVDAYGFSSPSDLGQDLATLVGAVRYADRAIIRHHSKGWARSLHVEMPVLELGLWNEKVVRDALEECLAYLTGDRWTFAFRRRKKISLPFGHQLFAISAPQISRVFVPYSHGVDSFAQMKLLSEREPQTDVICVFADSKPMGLTYRQYCRSKSRAGVKPLKVPIVVREPHHSEPSFRSRPFIYYVFAAYAALVSGASRVLIPENGQGSIGGSLVTLGNEAPHRSCHPGFSSRLSNLFSLLTRKRIEFEHPALFVTKGQVMRDLAQRSNPAEWLPTHYSCSHDQRHSHHEGRRVHCGVCGNCILRRVSAKAAGIEDITEYKFQDLSVGSLEESLLDKTDLPREMKAFADLARNGARGMQRLAEFSKLPDSPMIWKEVAGLASCPITDKEQPHLRLMSLLQEHACEWSIFLAACGHNSWIAKMARG
jgi:hypothetical protein